MRTVTSHGAIEGAICIRGLYDADVTVIGDHTIAVTIDDTFVVWIKDYPLPR